MARKINLLSDNTINQIAAGEVIENPASVVKEVVENALDAGAQTISIDIQGGGFQLIRISDDGVGMSRDDLALCVERHATSKIQKAEDLNHIHSMGFRGEALASIGAVSYLAITSSNGGKASFYDVKRGKIESAARRSGTTIEVRSLFHNVPARMKFQKSPQTSRKHITKTVTLLAMAHPHVAFTLSFDKEVTMQLAPGSRKERVHELLDEELDECELGFLGKPHVARLNRGGQFLFVNGRPVTSLPISFAVSDGYGTRLATSRHPVFVLFLEIPPEDVDVNVHPQKREVRFRDEAGVKRMVRTAIAKSFVQEMKVVQPFKTVAWPSEPVTLKDEPIWEEPALPLGGRAVPISLSDHFFLVDGPSLQLDPKWKGSVIVDLSAAYQRVAYQEILGGVSQTLLVPITLEVSEIDEERMAILQQLGVGIRPFGEKTCIVDALPPKVREEDVEAVLEGEKSKEAIARRLAKRGKRGYTQAEAISLVEELLKTDEPLLCPTGKPTMVHVQLGGLFERAALKT